MTAGTPSLRFPTATWVGLGVVVVTTVLAAWGFGASFPDASYLLAVVGGIAVGGGVAILAYRLRLTLLFTTLAGIAAVFVLGTPFTMPGEGIGFVFPSINSLAGLAIGSVHSWADMVTLTTPLEAPYYMAVGPFVATWLVSLIAVSLVVRWLPARPGVPWRKTVALSPVFALYGATVLLGTFDPYWPLMRGLALAAIVMLWLALRLPTSSTSGEQTRRAILRFRLVGTAVVVGGAVVATGLFAGSVEPPQDDRFVLREHVKPPFDPSEFPSPLSGFRRYTKDLTDDEMFTVSGLQDGDVLRIAVMDAYDGKLWTVSNSDGFDDASGAFELVGETLPLPDTAPLAATPDGAEAPPARTVEVTVRDYADIWIPLLEYSSQLTFTPTGDEPSQVVYNRWTTSGVTVDGLKPGVTYAMEVPATVERTDQALRGARTGVVNQPTATNVPSIIGAKAEEYSAGAKTPYEALHAIETFLHDKAFLSHGAGSDSVPSLAGHGADRLTALFERSVLVGDQEQYASAFALMARELGYPSRVVMGFAPDVPEGGGTVTVHGSDVSAWPEVYFEDFGWVPFFPTPENTDVPRDPQPIPAKQPQPNPRQPPRVEDQQDEVATPVQIDQPEDKPDPVEEGLPSWFWPLVLAILIPVLAYVIPVLIIGALKSARRARRKARGSDHRRAAAAWDELEDCYAELGYAIAPRMTRVERALDFEDQFQDELAARAGELEEIKRREQAKAKDKLAKLAAKQESSSVRSPMLTVRAATLVRGKHEGAWHPGVTGAGSDLPVLPGLRDLAVGADRAVFAGKGVEDDALEALWESATGAVAAGRRSVGWLRRELSKFRFRVRIAPRGATEARRVPAQQGSTTP